MKPCQKIMNTEEKGEGRGFVPDVLLWGVALWMINQPIL
jgi:hypothetical protein